MNDYIDRMFAEFRASLIRMGFSEQDADHMARRPLPDTDPQLASIEAKLDEIIALLRQRPPQ